jgi:glucose/arabinose dehydrogenase
MGVCSVPRRLSDRQASRISSGFVPDPAGKNVYGRMVGMAVAADGPLVVADDGGKVIW